MPRVGSGRRTSEAVVMIAVALGLTIFPATLWAAEAFLEQGGQVVIEAEHYDQKISRSGKDWVLETSRSGSSGDGYVTALPNSGTNYNTGYTTKSPELVYHVQFDTTGTYYIWVRGYAANGYDDSIHAGLDGTGPASADRITFSDGSWTWSRRTMGSETSATLNVTTPGLHTIHFWMREDGFQFDKFLLRTSSSSTAPSGTGPAESPRVQLGDQAITNVTAASGTSYAVDTLTVGALVYVDRDYAFTSIPSGYIGQEYIRTANNDKVSASGTALTFSLAQNAAVYVGYDSRATQLPAWLADGWTATGEALTSTDVPLLLYRKDFLAGSVVLGGNAAAPMQGAGSNYIVVAVPGALSPPLAAPSMPVMLEAEDMAVKTTGGATTGGWNIWSNGYIEDRVTFPSTDEYTFDIIARGSYAGGAWPLMELRIDQQAVATVAVDSSSWTTYTVVAPVAAGPHDVAVAFTNDYYNSSTGEDRNLYVDRVSIDYATTAPAADATPPSGSVLINGGAVATNNPSVTLTLSATDDSGTVAEMRFSMDGVTYTAPEPYATSKSLTLSAGDANKAVYVQFADGAGNWSDPASASIVLDTTPPVISITSPVDGAVIAAP